eukprot:EC823846.1.p1 GENE.EC823846.1~~EC823846.1.p1  ORF type:complete len:91 (+),score=16.67 EC823846.1:32-274(+)
MNKIIFFVILMVILSIEAKFSRKGYTTFTYEIDNLRTNLKSLQHTQVNSGLSVDIGEIAVTSRKRSTRTSNFKTFSYFTK